MEDEWAGSEGRIRQVGKDSNLQPVVLETTALPIELPTYGNYLVIAPLQNTPTARRSQGNRAAVKLFDDGDRLWPHDNIFDGCTLPACRIDQCGLVGDGRGSLEHPAHTAIPNRRKLDRASH